MEGIASWIVAAVVVAAVAAAVIWRFSRRANPNSLEAFGLQLPSAKVDGGEVARLRQSLRLKVMYDEAKIDRLIEAEREQMPTASEVEWYRAAVERWERDNR